ncbi:MAG: cytochrome c3 family protein, partial [Alphaproteobacteria bacterium]
LRSTLDASATPVAPAEIETPPLEVAPAEVDALPILAFLADRHAELGFSCAACHSDGLPAPGAQLPADLSAAVCLDCHGTFAEVAGRTDATFPNPHESHLGDLDCNSCHRAHAQPMDYCEQCHSFGFRVP